MQCEKPATGKFRVEMRNERYKIMNTMLHKKPGMRWTWTSPNGITKTEIGYILNQQDRLQHTSSQTSAMSTLKVTKNRYVQHQTGR